MTGSVADPTREDGVKELFSNENANFGFDAKICILPHSRDHILSFLTPNSTPKTDIDKTLHCTSINLKYVYVITHFAIKTDKEQRTDKLCDW